MADVTRYDVESNFPNSVDDLLCLSDVSLDVLPISNLHKQYLAEEHYTEAGALLENSPELDSLCASLFNLIENRILATQIHLDGKHSRWYEIYGEESPIESFDEPINRTVKPVWTNVEDLSRIGTFGLSSNYTLSSAGGFRP